MALIFSASSDHESLAHSWRIIAPLARWLYPQISAETLGRVVLYVRKCAHMTEYGILAWLIWRALRSLAQAGAQGWDWAEAGFALALAACYAATDEIHQTYVPTRQGSVWDVGIDVLGAVFGLGIVWVVVECRKSKSRTTNN
jgi:VanZ family protein